MPVIHSSLVPRGTPLIKPAKGEYRAEKLAKDAHEDYIETTAKLKAKARDGYRCRVPGCTTNLNKWRLEAAHVTDEGMGSRHSVSCESKHYASVCYLHHQGERSIHTGDLRMVAIEPERGGDGLLRWDDLTDAGWVTRGIS
jgi:hypothetical protein